MMLTQEPAEVENEQPAPEPEPEPSKEIRNRTATRPGRPIDVVTVEPPTVTSPDAPETAFSSASRVSTKQLYYSMIEFLTTIVHIREKDQNCII